ncbi:hypothetical protein [Texcoconibacillus texcoconensis]|uniref:Tetratricopeptide repeat protein n=1 Tax=Texcoconibacillus texcoconensis TaxID=1095777 RepID=A0A840QTX1_9BACI|nr:hypothetical protein [Texcoconibacillus texcoconensis]MBB5174825.1 hypothetical protein [Texcoconibacillus texcoconensis]
MMEQSPENLRELAQKLTTGYKKVQEGNYEQGKEILEPLMPIFHRSDQPNMTLLVHYGFAQVGTGNVEGFLETYAEVKEISPANKREAQLKDQAKSLVNEVLEHIHSET